MGRFVSVRVSHRKSVTLPCLLTPSQVDGSFRQCHILMCCRCRLQTLLTSHKCHTSMSSDTRVSHLTSMCSDDLPSRWVASYLCLTSLKCHSHDDLQHFRRTFWGKPDIPCWREASHRPPPPKPVLAMSMIAQQVCVLQISSDCHPTRKGHTACKSCWLKAYLH